MAIFCLPKSEVEKLKNSALKGEINIRALYDMSSAERRDFFVKHTDGELGKFINTEFEKAMISKQQTAITDWAKSVFTPEVKAKPVYKTVLDKIDNLEHLGVLTPASEKAFLEDLVSDKLGISVSPEEVKNISEKAKVIGEAQLALGNDLGNPLRPEENLAFFKAKKEMDDYLQGLTPASNIRILTGTIGRGMMLASVKSPLLNIGSNIEIGFAEALARRLSRHELTGANNTVAVEYVKMVNKIYQATGYDISRMMNLSDSGASGERVLGETVHAQGPGVVRKVGRGIEDLVFKQLMGAPDVAFSAAHFADSVNLNAFKMANGDKEKATAMMYDAMRIDPQTAEGELLRGQAVLDAQKATWTDSSWAARVSLGIRKILNDVSGDARVGDYVLPFVKTPANVIATGIEYAGGGIVGGLVKTVKAWREGNVGSEEHLKSVSTGLVRSGLGLVAAVILTEMLNDDDFVGAFDPSRAQIEALRNSNTNSIRLGGKWISTAWLGPLAVPVTAMMYARKYGGTGSEKTFQYGKGVLSAVKDLPGVTDLYDFAKTTAYKKNQTLKEMTGTAQDYITSELYSRLVPSIISDTAKAMDTYERKTGKGTASVQAKFPGLRNLLPVKTNIFGEEIKDEPAWSNILFGARVKTDKEDATIKEIVKISDDTDKPVTFTDWDKSSSKTLAQYREKVGEEEYNKTKILYGVTLKKELENLFANTKYQSATNEEKLKAINAMDTLSMKKVFLEKHFVYIRGKN